MSMAIIEYRTSGSLFEIQGILTIYKSQIDSSLIRQDTVSNPHVRNIVSHHRHREAGISPIGLLFRTLLPALCCHPTNL